MLNRTAIIMAESTLDTLLFPLAYQQINANKGEIAVNANHIMA